MGQIANWRGHFARVQSYYEEGEKFLAKAKNVLIVLAIGKYFGLAGWLLYLLAPAILASVVLTGWLWIKHGWYAHGTEITALDRWTPVMVWDRWMQVRMLEKLGVELNHFPADRLPEAFTRVMASTQGRRG